MATTRLLWHFCVVVAVSTFASRALAQCPPQRLTSPSDFAGDFGDWVVMNDRHLIVGDSLDHTLCGDVFCANGYAWAYQRDADGEWVFTQRLEPASLGWSWGFGRAVALDGDRALITRGLGLDCNMVFEFEFDGERWVEIGPICVPPLTGVSGAGVLLRDDVALVQTLSGLLVYEGGGGIWTLIDQLSNPSGTSEPSAFGVAFDLDDDWLVIGASNERFTEPNGGAAYVYRRLPGGGLELAQKLVAPDISIGPRFGASVALEGDTLIIGGYLSDRTFTQQGAVYVHELVDGEWVLRQELTHSEPESRDAFGISLVLEGDTLLVGAFLDDTPLTFGSVYLFERGADEQWREVRAVLPDQPAVRYGSGLALSNGIAAIGARDTLVSGESAGSVDIFDLSCFLCSPDLDSDGVLTIFDFLTFLNLFEDGDAAADFDGDGELTLFDFLEFQTAFDAGC